MPTLRWNVCYFDREPKTEFEAELEKIRDLREILDVDYDMNYTLEQLEEMMHALEEVDFEE